MTSSPAMQSSQKKQGGYSKESLHFTRNAHLGMAATAIAYVLTIFQLDRSIQPVRGFWGLLDSAIFENLVGSLKTDATYFCIVLSCWVVPIGFTGAIFIEGLLLPIGKWTEGGTKRLDRTSGVFFATSSILFFAASCMFILQISEIAFLVFFWVSLLCVAIAAWVVGNMEKE